VVMGLTGLHGEANVPYSRNKRVLTSVNDEEDLHNRNPSAKRIS
jgi:hypothetical protein